MPRRARPKRGARRGVGWWWLLGLIVVGAAVVAARTFERRTSSPEPTPTLMLTAIAIPRAAAPQPTATLVRAVPTPIDQKVIVTSVPTRVTPTALATHTTAGTPRLSATATTPPHASSETVVPTATVVVARQTSANVALTFDAGADRGYAEDILDVLQEQHALASFGITGNWAKANPDLVRRMVADGHLVFNHTLDHRSFTGVSDGRGGLSASARRAELDEADAIIAPLIGHTTRPFYRLPYGDDDARVAGDLAPDGYTRKVGWTVDTLGWRGAASADIVARSLKLATPGAVLVMHVGRASQDAIALPQLIHALRDRGFGFTRVDQS